MTPEEIKAKELIDKYRGVAKYGQRQWGKLVMQNNVLLYA
jgi:hypothetical protein